MSSTEARAFISHSWKDKPFARRVARRLAHRGVRVWIDESEMQIGDRLSERLTKEIQDSSHLAVLLTKDAAASKWVAKELEVARAARVPVLPLIAEPGLKAAMLDEELGVEVWDRLEFEVRMETVARAIRGSADTSERDFALVKKDLDAIGQEAPELKPMIEQLANEGRITHSQLGATTLSEESRHPAETALIALFETSTAPVRYVISLVAARFYWKLGVGWPVLRAQIESQPDEPSDVETLFHHLGDRTYRPEDLPGIFRLFQLATPPKDQAFTGFVRANFQQFTLAQRDQAIAYMVTPDRGPGGFAIDAAYELFKHFPDSQPLRDLWFFWVNGSRFGGKKDEKPEQDPQMFFEVMNHASEAGLKQFDPIMDHFETCFRGIVRSRTLGEFLPSVGVLLAASQSRYVRRAKLAAQLDAALGSHEWQSVAEHSKLLGPLFDLAHAVARDKDIWPAIEDLHRRLKEMGFKGNTDLP